MNTYEFTVTDKDGLWGDLRQEAASEEQARQLCHRWLVDEYPLDNGYNSSIDFETLKLTLK